MNKKIKKIIVTTLAIMMIVSTISSIFIITI